MIHSTDMYAISFEGLSKTIEGNGGRIVDVDEPKLTHVVIDKRDDSRRLDLIKLTSKSVSCLRILPCINMENHRPKRRHLVVSEYIQACLDEQTLLDEEGKHVAFKVHL
jgi:DNA ligase-4